MSSKYISEKIDDKMMMKNEKNLSNLAFKSEKVISKFIFL